MEKIKIPFTNRAIVKYDKICEIEKINADYSECFFAIRDNAKYLCNDFKSFSIADIWFVSIVTQKGLLPIKRFDTGDEDYNRRLAEDFCKMLNEE